MADAKCYTKSDELVLLTRFWGQMEEKMVQIIFSDIDGTLINRDYQVTAATRNSIVKAVQQGMVFVPVSARMPDAIQPIIQSIGISSPIISYNGALIQDQEGEVLASLPMQTQLALDICQFVEGHYPDIAWNIYSYQNWYAMDRQHEWIAREEAIVGLVSQEKSLSDLTDLKEVHKVLLMGDPEQIPSLEKELKKNFPELSIAQSAPYFIEIMAAGIEKGQAVRTFSDHLGVPLSETIAFGDNYNDLDMLKTVGKGYVMANGPVAVQEAIGQVTADHNQDGIAQVLDTYL